MTDLNDPSSLETAADEIQLLRRSLLVEDVESSGSSIYTREFFRLALAALETAESNMRLAQYHQAHENGERF